MSSEYGAPMHLPYAALAIPALVLAALSAPEDEMAGPQDEMGWTGVLDEASFAALHELKEGEAPPLLGEDVEVAGMDAYISRPPAGEPLGAVIVIHEWWGLNDHVKHWSDRLASDGYVALAIDLYDGVVATTRDEAMDAMRSVDGEAALAKLLDAHAYLTDDEDVAAERTACVGWCFGGGWSLKLAIAEPELDAAIMYYGRLINDVEQLAQMEAPLLGVFGNEDRGIPPASVEEFAAAMKKAGNDLTLRQYDANHAFANPSSGRYDAENAALAWRETRAFLCEKLYPGSPSGSLGGGSRTLEFTAPDGWQETEPAVMSIATLDLPGNARCTVTVLGGDGGGVEPNINRWHMQLGADTLSDEQIEALPLIPMFGALCPSVRIEGTFAPQHGDTIEDAVLLGAIATLEDEAVFVKLTGPRNAVDEQGAAFAAFCRSLR